MIENNIIISLLIIGLGAVFMMLIAAFTKWSNLVLSYLTLAIISLAIYFQIDYLGELFALEIQPELFNHMLRFDSFASLFNIIFLVGAFLMISTGRAFMQATKFFIGETFALVLFAIFSMMLLSMANELLTAFIALESASVSIYILVGINRYNVRASEALFKYLLLGSFAGAFFLLGIAFIYAQVGSTHLGDIHNYISNHDNNELIIMGGILMLITILFKISAIPFGAWTLDVYDGASLPITAFMAGTFKIAIFSITLRILLVDYQSISELFQPLLIFIAVITIIGGSLLTLAQQNIKRMLAASSIVHSGYLLIALSATSTGLSESSAPSIIFYLVAYFLSAIGAFGILSYISVWDTERTTYEDLKGFSHSHPLLAAMMSVFMLSFAGFPSTIGFLGKFYIFTSAIESGLMGLAFLGVLAAFVSIYYYFKVIAMMYFYDQKQHYTMSFSFTPFVIGIVAISVLWGGIGTGLVSYIPGANILIQTAQASISSLFL
ncbi:NADH-quinone oxidoreductase subunit N [Sulfurimonas sp. MAG313]|nr:NADH-quinone oxidoreductase subunit N [Sulfurimonas sp. MAG313]MDF1880866.1 NADH-quinone oxidoreductase subunit N [Sulfurimonas sp. MAG313]